MNHSKLFSDRDVFLAKQHLEDITKRQIYRAVWFRNCLRALLRDVDRAQSPTPPLKIMAVDTTEIAAATLYNMPAFRGFTFGRLLEDVIEDSDAQHEETIFANTELETTDKLIIQYLFEHRPERYVLLDPHAEEVAALRDFHARAWDRTSERLFNASLGNFSGFSTDHLDRILDFLKLQSPSAISSEWQSFCTQFLPRWRSDMLDEVWRGSKSLRSIDTLISDGKYLFLRPPSFGRRSLLAFLTSSSSARVAVKNVFDWDDYKAFVTDPIVGQQFEEVYQITRTLIANASRRGARRSRESLDLAADRDARAFATTHIWNSFFLEKQVNARLEMVTRSPVMHNVISSLPEDRIRVTLRHPFLLPDIYQFDPASLAAIGGVLNRIDGVIEPYLKNTGSVTERDNDDDTKLRDAANIAKSIVPLFRDILAIQHSLEQSLETMRDIYAVTISSQPDADGSKEKRELNQPEAGIIERVEAVFAAIKEQLRNRNDPFSREAMLSLIERNSALVEFEAGRTFSEDEYVTLRVLDFRLPEHPSDGSGSNEVGVPQSIPYLSVRAVDPTEPTFSRMVFIHSTRMIDLFSEHGLGVEKYSETEPTELRVPVYVILKGVKSALDALRDRRASDEMNDSESASSDALAAGDFIYNLNATLLACLTFASKRRFDTAISLTSTILHQITGEIRRGGERSTQRQRDIRLSLAFRELFLLRHYCERALAMSEYFSARSGRTTISKNFARAQRDLDFAMLMAEDAERVITQGAGTKRQYAPLPEFEEFKDFRLRLAHVNGWTDQFLIAARDRLSKAGVVGWQDDESEMRLRRFGIWTAAGLVKEVVADADFASRARMALTGGAKLDAYRRRYLAYFEARNLEAALTLFLIFLAYGISRDMAHLWSHEASPPPERILVYREWERWWEGYAKLQREYNFQIRAYSLISTICAALAEINLLRAKPGKLGVASLYSNVINELQRSLTRIVTEKKPSQFIRALAEATLKRVNELPNRNQR